MKEVALRKDQERTVLLEKHEKEYFRLKDRVQHDLIGMALHLLAIRDQKLYEDRGFLNFSDYCVEWLEMDPETLRRRIIAAEVHKSLKDSGVSESPVVESHLLELDRLEPEQRAQVWREILKDTEDNEEKLTAEFVRKAVNKALGPKIKQLSSVVQAATPRMPKDGAANALAEPDLDLGSDLPGPTQEGSKSRISLNQEGEEALVRIRDLCGEMVAKAIESGTLEISQRELVQWSDYEHPEHLTDDILRNRYTVTRAINRDTEQITAKTTVGKLLDLARVRKGFFETEVENNWDSADKVKLTVTFL